MKLSLSLLSLAVLAGLSAVADARADAPAGASTLDTVRVEAERAKKSKSRNQNVTVLSAADLDAEMANNMEEAIRYIPGVSIVDMGRFGDNGFNIRGLESDRVAITVDGLWASRWRPRAPTNSSAAAAVTWTSIRSRACR